MSTKKNIPQDEWQDRLSTFSSGHRGRIAAIATQGMTIIEGKHFRDMEFDPKGKGDDMIITLGTDKDLFTHTVNKPREVYLVEEDDGEVSSMEINDESGDTTIIHLRTKF